MIFLWEFVASHNTVAVCLCLVAGESLLKPALWLSLNKDET